jgi:hypothetical protein
MPFKADLEAHIRESYKLIHEYEKILQMSDNPKEKLRAQTAIDEQWTFVKGYLDEYIPLCQRLQISIANDLVEIVAHFPEYDNAKELQIKGVPTQEPTRVIEVFFSYAHEDERLRNELAKQLSLLQSEGLINEWHDRQINPGKEWASEIDSHLNTAHIILLLVSPDFMASSYGYGVEMKRAMERYALGEARVIPIILRPVDWQNAPFSKLQALPKDGKPVKNWANTDKALLDVAKGIRKVVEELKANSVSDH